VAETALGCCYWQLQVVLSEEGTVGPGRAVEAGLEAKGELPGTGGRRGRPQIEFLVLNKYRSNAECAFGTPSTEPASLRRQLGFGVVLLCRNVTLSVGWVAPGT
jgi:hypothetical protein